jgi:hypothetical protein
MTYLICGAKFFLEIFLVFLNAFSINGDNYIKIIGKKRFKTVLKIFSTKN